VPSLFVSQLQTLIQKRLAAENELLLDPAFFPALQRHLPEISQIELQLKRGRAHNELTRFRYDVVLHKERAITTVHPPLELDWQKQQGTLPALHTILQEQRPAALHITQIPNARLRTDLQAVALLQNMPTLESVGALWEALLASNQAEEVDPEDFWSLENTFPYRVIVTWSDTGAPGCYDVFLVERRLPGETYHSLLSIDGRSSDMQASTPEPAICWRKYANDPFQAETRNILISELREYLKQKLPDYMLPGIIMELDTLPLSPNGKVDYQALPASDGSRPALKNAFLA